MKRGKKKNHTLHYEQQERVLKNNMGEKASQRAQRVDLCWVPFISVKHEELAPDKAVYIVACHPPSFAAHTCLCAKHSMNQKALPGFLMHKSGE